MVGIGQPRCEEPRPLRIDPITTVPIGLKMILVECHSVSWNVKHLNFTLSSAMCFGHINNSWVFVVGLLVFNGDYYKGPPYEGPAVTITCHTNKKPSSGWDEHHMPLCECNQDYCHATVKWLGLHRLVYRRYVEYTISNASHPCTFSSSISYGFVTVGLQFTDWDDVQPAYCRHQGLLSFHHHSAVFMDEKGPIESTAWA